MRQWMTTVMLVPGGLGFYNTPVGGGFGNGWWQKLERVHGLVKCFEQTVNRRLTDLKEELVRAYNQAYGEVHEARTWSGQSQHEFSSNMSELFWKWILHSSQV